MDGRVSVVDPATISPTGPVSNLAVRTPFRRRDHRLDLMGIEAGARSAWHRRDGALFGWVRAGRGRIEYGADAAVAVGEGDFFRVPPDAAHRYAAGASLSLLAVAAGGTALSLADAPADRNVDAVEPAVVEPDSLVPTVESANLVRETPFPDADAGVLVMRVRAAGGAAAGWHHHGENVYFGYAVDGPSETEYGPDGADVARIERGECFHVPPGLVHRDTNPTDEPHTGIIWLCGGEPWVVNVDGPD